MATVMELVTKGQQLGAERQRRKSYARLQLAFRKPDLLSQAMGPL